MGKVMNKKQKKTISVSQQLRKAIETSALTRYRISKETGIAQSTLSEFVHGNRSLSLANVDKICELIKLELTQKKQHGLF
jgi:transcriptional regulator with XRE-family HTH domain